MSCSAQIQCIARCFGSVVCMWCINKEETKLEDWIVQVKLASKHYKPTIKLASQKNTWQFLVALSHKKP